MNTLELCCIWKLEGPLHVGTGLSRGGYADRLIRRDSEHQALIPGDAVKGAIRMSAERMLRWLLPEWKPEEDEKSLPTHPVLRRLFRPLDIGVYYRFEPARKRSGKNEPFRISATAIDRNSRTAKAETLRTIEASSRFDEFEVRIVGEGGEWLTPGSHDWFDGQFLAAALIATDTVGGKRGSGYGRLLIEEYRASAGTHWPDPSSPEALEALQSYLREEARLEHA